MRLCGRGQDQSRVELKDATLFVRHSRRHCEPGRVLLLNFMISTVAYLQRLASASRSEFLMSNAFNLKSLLYSHDTSTGNRITWTSARAVMVTMKADYTVRLPVPQFTMMHPII